jgi:hypothetical protein
VIYRWLARKAVYGTAVSGIALPAA